MHPIPTRILLLLLLFSSFVAAANFTQCLENFRNESNTTIGGVDSRGDPTSPAEAIGLTYETCTAKCGSGAESFRWREFAQLFSSWLLPWLALISQLPFNSGNYADDFVSVAMSVGSPALAAYSLVLTTLSARLVYRRAQRIEGENKTAVAEALITLQQTPLQLTKEEHLLASIQMDDQWRREIAERLSERNAWSLATGSSVAWVVIAFLFTLIDSFVSLDNTRDTGTEGHAVGTLWLWLLCLVIGWLWVPTFTCGAIKSAIRHANEKAAGGNGQKVTKAYNSVRTKLASRLPKQISILKGPKKSTADPGESEKAEGGSIQDDTKPVGKETEPKANPLPDPAHHRSTVSFQLTESQQGPDPTVSANQTTDQSIISLPRSDVTQPTASQSTINLSKGGLFIPKDDFGSLNRDEFRHAATFNYSRIMGHLVLVDDVMKALNQPIRKKAKKKRNSEVANSPSAGKVVFPPGALIAMFNASVFALILQCGITAAAAIIIVFTPTVGLGCRSLGYIVYGGIAIVIFFLTITSTIFARISETRHEKSTIVKNFTAFIAIALRRISLLLAFMNATGLIVLSCFQFSHFLDNCYCNASVLGRGTANSYVLTTYEGLVSTMKTARISATALSAMSMATYMIFLWLMSSLPADIDHL